MPIKTTTRMNDSILCYHCLRADHFGLFHGSKFTSPGKQTEPELRCSTRNLPWRAWASHWSYLIGIIVEEAVTGRGIDAVGVTKQKARIADTAGLADDLTVGLGVLTGCWAGAGFVVGIWGAAC